MSLDTCYTKSSIRYFYVTFSKHILTHIVFLLNKMINEIKKYLPPKIKSITAKYDSFLKILLNGIESTVKLQLKLFHK